MEPLGRVHQTPKRGIQSPLALSEAMAAETQGELRSTKSPLDRKRGCAAQCVLEPRPPPELWV